VRTIHPKGYGVRPIKNAVIVTASRTQTVINNGSFFRTEVDHWQSLSDQNFAFAIKSPSLVR
jgi:hypothetical protein